MVIGPHLFKSWTKTRSLFALSSAEPELYPSVGATAKGLGMQPVAQDVEMDRRIRLLADASAALGIISRRGVGKVRNFDTTQHLDPTGVGDNESAV